MVRLLALVPLVALFGLLPPSYPVIKVTGEPPVWRLEPMAVIVSPDGAGFARVGSVLLDPHGGLMLVDRKEKLIYRYSDQGKLLGTVGRVGSGPSEYRFPYALAWLGEELMVYDPSNGRILRWDRNAKYLGQWPSGRLTGMLPVFPGPGGTVWLRQGGLGPSGKYQPNFIRFPQSGTHDTIWFPYQAPNVGDSPPKGKDGYVVCTQKGGFSWFFSPFSEAPYRTVVTWEGQILTATSIDYRLGVMRVPGDTVKVLEHTIVRAPISDAEWKAGLKEYEEYLAKNPSASCTGRQVRPAAKPAIRDVATDDSGRVWVERYMKTGFQWEAWRGDKIMGAFAVADSASNEVTAFAGDRVAFVRYRDDDGGYEVRLYRIRK